MAALKEAVREQRRAQERACRDILILVPSLGGAQQVGARIGCFQLGFSCLCYLNRVEAEGCSGPRGAVSRSLNWLLFYAQVSQVKLPT